MLGEDGRIEPIEVLCASCSKPKGEPHLDTCIVVQQQIQRVKLFGGDKAWSSH